MASLPEEPDVVKSGDGEQPVAPVETGELDVSEVTAEPTEEEEEEEPEEEPESTFDCEWHCVQQVVQSFIVDASVLDLVFRNEVQAIDLLEGGAAQVTAVSDSEEVIKSAEATIKDIKLAEQITLVHGDAHVKQDALFPSAPFDVVLGLRLIKRWEGPDALSVILQNVSDNLKEGGVFVAVISSADDEGYAELVNEERKVKDSPVDAEEPAKEETAKEEPASKEEESPAPPPTPAATHSCDCEPPCSCTCCAVLKSLVEESARAAGLTGAVEWIDNGVDEEEDSGVHAFTILTIIK